MNSTFWSCENIMNREKRLIYSSAALGQRTVNYLSNNKQFKLREGPSDSRGPNSIIEKGYIFCTNMCAP